MNSLNFVDIVIYLVLAIAVVAILGSLSKSRFTRTVFKDEFRNKNQIGKQNLGKLKKEQAYREIAKVRQLEEAKHLEAKLNPKVTHSLVVATKDVRKKEDELGG